MNANTPKNFAIQLGSLITLYISVIALMMLIFGIINLSFPDELDKTFYYGSESIRESMRMAIAMLIVFFPTYIVLTRLSNQHRRHEQGGEYTVLAKWLVYLSLLGGGAALLGDLVTTIIYFLNGEITTRFILKALAFFIVVGAAFSYYILDARGHFKNNVKQSVQFAGAAGVIVILALVYGFMNIETPAEVRELKLDQQQTNDLQEIQWSIEEYYRVEQSLPETLAEFNVPNAPENRPTYEYEKVDDMTYQLCAEFTQESSDSAEYRPVLSPVTKDNYSWSHEAGRHCFKRVVTPEVKS